MTRRSDHWRRAVRRLRRLHTDRRGIVALITAISFPVLLAFAALALDVGYLQDMKRRQKNAAIAAAFAAGHELWLVNGEDEAEIEAKAEADRNNFGEDDDVTITVEIPPVSGPYTGVANHAEVILEKTVPTYFAGVFGKNFATVRSRAVTGLIRWGDACVIALDPSRPRAMRIDGSATLETRCGVQVNSTADNALFLTGTPLCLQATTMIGVTGGVFGAGNSPCVSPEPIQAPAINDPLDYLHDIAPYYGGTCDYNNTIITAADGFTQLLPGTYCAGTKLGFKTNETTGLTTGGQIPKPAIQITGGEVDFAPGVYVLLGGMRISGNSVVTGDEVTFFNTSSNPNRFMSWGEFDITGDSSVTLSAPTSGYYEGVLMWDDYRAPDRMPSHMIIGSATSTFGGALYFKETTITYGGSGTSSGWGMVVADRIVVVGNALVPGDEALNDGGMTPPTRKVTLLE